MKVHGRFVGNVLAEQLVLSHTGRWQARAAPKARDIILPNVDLDDKGSYF